MAREPKSSDDKVTSSAIDRESIRTLAEILDETGLTEIEYERDGVRLRVARQAQAITVATPAAQHASSGPATVAAATEPVASDPAKHPGTLTSPMVGTAYLAPEPGARPYVEVGSQVRAGQTLLIIEAMKTMNQIPAPRAGRIAQIFVGDGQPVEFGEPLMVIE